MSDAARHETVDTTVVVQKLDEGRTGFFDLPPELRNEIYRYCVTFPGTVKIHGSSVRAQHRRTWIAKRETPTLVTGLLFSCRIVHYEALAMIYATNRFQVNQYSAITFLQGNGSNWKHIRQIKLQHLSRDTLGTCLNILKHWPNLELVEVAAGYAGGALWYNYNNATRKVARLVGHFVKFLHDKRKGTHKKDALEVLQFERMEDTDKGRSASTRYLDAYNGRVEETKAIIKATLNKAPAKRRGKK